MGPHPRRGAGMNDLLDARARRPRSRGRPARALVAGRPGLGLATAHPGARAGTSPPRSPIWPGPTRRRTPPRPTRHGGTRWSSRRIADPDHAVDRAALTGGVAAPSVILDRWRHRPVPARRRALRSYPDGQKMPWYGPPMSATSMATARFMETWAHSPRRARGARRRAGAHRPDAPRRAPRASAPATSRSPCTGSTRPPRSSGISLDRAVRRPVGLGPGGRRADA